MKSWSPEEAMRNILMGCKVMGWSVLIPDVHLKAEVPGLIIGELEFVDQFWSPGIWEVWDPNEESHQ